LTFFLQVDSYRKRGNATLSFLSPLLDDALKGIACLTAHRVNFVVKVKLLIFCVLILWACQASAGMLNSGQGLSAGEVLYSNNGNFFATMQSDGNFVVYKTGGQSLWSTNTTGSGADWAVMQTDGNFVLYNRSQGRAVWSSNTAFNQSSYAAITDFGQWLVFRNDPLWSSNTSDHSNPIGANAAIIGPDGRMEKEKAFNAGQYNLVFQSDGNLVLYSPLGAIWSSGTSGKANATSVQMGVLFFYDNKANVFKSIPTLSPSQMSKYTRTEQGSTYMALQADGNLVTYIPKRVFASYSPYAPPDTYQSAGPGCYGPPDACFGSTLPIYKYTW
jgi:hypothetical protein